MNSYPILFKTPEQLRRLGARGGRARARNRRARQRSAQAEAALPETPAAVRTESAAQAIATLDIKFPWLRHAERRVSRY